MSNLVKAIGLAIKGGWRKDLDLIRVTKSGKAFFKVEGYFPKQVMPVSDILLDPLFWQALGKALGWPEHNHLKRSYESKSWRGQSFMFFEHLMEGKDAESFFAVLLREDLPDNL